jgi:quercetin dioxygenase-like cupin family protein
MSYPIKIENGAGELLVFERLVQGPEGDCLEVRNEVQPGAGPPMHVHFKQEEALTVVDGKLGYQVLGEAVQFAGPGETVVFKAGVAHKFWAEGDEVLRCTGYIKPAHNIVYFLAEIYQSTKNNDGHKPDDFEAAYLLHKYRSEFDMLEIPGFVKSVIFPVLRLVGGMSGKFKKYENGPPPVV